MSRERGEELRPTLKAVAARMLPQITPIGFPKSTDIDFTMLAPLSPGTLNNIGDPTVPGLEQRNVKDLEREVVQILGDLFNAPPRDRWGCVTSGGTEGNLYGLHLARTYLPDGIVYFSDSAHYSVAKAAHILNMTAVRVATTEDGELDYGELSKALRANAGRPAVVVATVGTTMTEAVDNVAAIIKRLDTVGVPTDQRYIHVDAALTGIPLALEDGDLHPSCDLGNQVDSLTISGHKFLATPEPCGVLITRQRHRDRVAQSVSYIGGVDATIAGSRSGHTVLQLWWALRSVDEKGHRRRAERARAVADYALRRLQDRGWEAWKRPRSFTVVLKSPPQSLVERWSLANQDGWSHIICVPGVRQEDIAQFVEELTRPTVPADVAPRPVRRPWWRGLLAMVRRPSPAGVLGQAAGLSAVGKS